MFVCLFVYLFSINFDTPITLLQGKGKKLTYFLEGEDRAQRMRRISHERMRADRAGGPTDRDQRCVSASNLDYRGKIFTMQNGMVRELCQVPELSALCGDIRLFSPDDQNVSSSTSNDSDLGRALGQSPGDTFFSHHDQPSLSSVASASLSEDQHDTNDGSGCKAGADVTNGSAYGDLNPADVNGDCSPDTSNVLMSRVYASGPQGKLGSPDSAECQHTHQGECEEPSEMRCLLDDTRVRVTPPTRQLTHLLHGRTPETVL